MSEVGRLTSLLADRLAVLLLQANIGSSGSMNIACARRDNDNVLAKRIEISSSPVTSEGDLKLRVRGAGHITGVSYCYYE